MKRRPKGKAISPPIRLIVTLLTFVFCAGGASAQTKLDPNLINSSYANYKSGTRTSNGVTWKYKGAGTYYDGGDYDGWNVFTINNATLSPAKPYIDFTFVAYDWDDGDNDYTYNNGFFVKYVGEEDFVMVSYAPRITEHIENNYASTQGVLIKARWWDNSYNNEFHAMRFYPRYLEAGKKIEMFRIVSYMLYNNRNGNSRPSYGNTGQMVDYMFIYDIPITYDFSSLSGKATFTEKAGNKVEFKSTEFPINGVATQNNSSSWVVNKHVNLADINVNWSTSGTRVYFEDANGGAISSFAPSYSVNSSTNKVTSGSATITPADYSVARQYATAYQLSRSFTTGTNSYTDNVVHNIRQTIYYHERTAKKLPMAHATELTATTDMWAPSVQLTWTPYEDGEVDSNGKWYVFRYLKSEGESSRGEAIATLPYGTTQYTDKDVTVYDSPYVYEVSFCHADWGELAVPEPSLTKRIEVSVDREFEMKTSLEALEQDGVSAGMKLTWTHIPVQEPDVQFKVWRRIRPTDAGGNPVSDEAAADIPYVQIGTVDRKNAEAQEHSYVDKDASNPCALYEYQISTLILEKEFKSESVMGSIVGGSRVKRLTATKGTYGNVVKVQWEVQQVGSTATKYTLLRRLLGAGGNFVKIYTTQGTASEYQYEDNTVFPGNYYEYKVEVYTVCSEEDGSFSYSNDLTADGFSQSTGTISGRITYGTGTAVEGVKVVLTKSSDDYSTKNQFYALESTAAGGGISYTMSTEQAAALFGAGQTTTFQLWVNPLSQTVDADGNHPNLKPALIATEAFMLYGEYDEATNRYNLKFRTNSATGTAQDIATGSSLAANSYSHLTMTVEEKQLTLRIIDKSGKLTTAEVTLAQMPLLAEARTLRVGSALKETDLTPHTFKGLIDEVRVWNKALGEKDILTNYDRLLAGSEQGLCIYWPVDEGIKGQTTAYDYSKTEGVANECHGSISEGTVRSTNVPSEEQFSLYGLTDAEGNYVIRGIPIGGEGTNYVATPLMGIHEFSPAYITRYVSANSLTHSGADMEDVSSFEVTGTVYYEGTNYPVEGAFLYVDGTMCNRDGEAVATDAEGRYSISVPIGDHHIEVRKNGHTFVNNGRYPLDPDGVGTKYTFDREMSNLSFYDNTMVTVAGRVVGGAIEEQKPIGMGQSVNNIGQAVITLTAGSYSMNWEELRNGTSNSWQNGTAERNFERGSSYVNSAAYAGKEHDATNIYITTDPQTGEFAVQLPPVQYAVTDISIPSNTEITFENLPLLDATDPQVVLSDTVMLEDGVQRTFDYHASMVQSHRAQPVFTVTDKGADEGAFGEKNYTLKNADGTEAKLSLYSVKDGAAVYNYGLPIFVQKNPYTFHFKAYEEYVNYDEKEKPVVNRVPLSGTVVTITNQLSASQAVRGADDEVAPGRIDNLQSNQLELDSVGEADYKFTAGFPNILEDQDFARGLSISFENNGQTVNWEGNETFRGVILGSLPTGTNFVTAGPDKVAMVLRDPPGSNSQVIWEKGRNHTESVTWTGTFTSDTSMETVSKLGFDITTASGTSFFEIQNEFKSVNDLTIGVHLTEHVEDAVTSSITTTTTKTVSTSDSPDYVGADGDVYIGNSTNVLFGEARSVTFEKAVGTNNYALALKNTMVTSTKFGTTFQYTQYYVKNVLLPNMANLRNNMLRQVSESEYAGYVNNGKYPVYITKLSPDDERFGTPNHDAKVWGTLAIADKTKLEGPSYKVVRPVGANPKECFTDSVFWYNEQIRLWEEKVYENERMKLKAIDNRSEWFDTNLSFDAGTTIESSTGKTTTEVDVTTTETEILAIVGSDWGTVIQETGVLFSFREEIGGGFNFADEDMEENTEAFTYVLAESGFNDALTVDVFKAPDEKGPIFVTRGGQTSCPHEGEVVTEYYRPGTSISTATMQVEIPEITCTNPSAVDIPAGSFANYELQLANLSETGDDIWFNLVLVDDSNPNGAKLTMDGAVLTTGRSILVPAGQTLIKTLQIEQTNPDVLDYENIRIALMSQCQGDPTGIYPAIGDTVSLSAHFVPSCSDITLAIEDRTMNMFTGDVLKMKIADVNRGYRSFKGLRVQYKYANDVDWKLAKEYVINEEDLNNTNELLPEGSPIAYNFDMSSTSLFPDGTYTFRAITMCDFGAGEVNNASEEIIVTKDMSRPQMLGSANPANGILGSGDDIFVTFNEAIRSGALTSGDNFIVTGVLNGANVDHNTSLQLAGAATAAATTEADINLDGKSFAGDMWLKAESAGTIMEHGAGQNKFGIGLDANMHLVISVNGTEHVSEKAVPADKWVFLSYNYIYEEGNSSVNAQVAHDAETITLFSAQSVADYHGNGRLSVGKNLTGSLHGLTLWNRARTMKESQGEMHTTKYAATPNLIGYWKMDEGAGATLKDCARNRHMNGSGNWALNNENMAAAFDGATSHADLDITACSALDTDDYAVEFWFKGEQQTNATLFSVNGDQLSLGADAEGKLALTADGVETQLSANDYLDGNWHHFALNVLRNGTTTAYVDGTSLKQIASGGVPALASDALVLGAKRSLIKDASTSYYKYEEHFKGEMDEVRFWNAKLTGAALSANRNTRVDTTAASGLVAYYPFETRSLDSYGQVVTNFSTSDQSVNKATATNTAVTAVAQAASAPGLKEAPAVTNLQFSFTASEKQVYITLLDDAARLEGTTVNLTLRNVRDMNNNIMQPIVWTAYVNRNTLSWSEDEISLTKEENKENPNFTVSIENKGGATEQWTLTNVPAWLEVEATQGSLKPLSSRNLVFKVNESTPIGSYEETIYMYGNDGIHTPLNVRLKVKAEGPGWTVNPADFENTMSVIGRIQVDGVYSEDTDDLVGAFINGKCVGIGSPSYSARYDAFYVLLDIYGNEAEGRQPVTFKVWDASTGDTYPDVTTSSSITFGSNKMEGTMDAPVIWNAKEQREQKIALNKGWTWLSAYVRPDNPSVSAVFKDAADKVTQIKHSNLYLNNSAEMPWDGSLDSVEPGKLYKVNAATAAELSIFGQLAAPADLTLTVNKNWNWLGYVGTTSMTLDDAFSGLAPEDGDLVKGQKGFAIYQGYEWVGSLTTLIPGQGYMYKSVAAGTKTFSYPAATEFTQKSKKLQRMQTLAESLLPEHFANEAASLYSGSMTITSKVMQNGEALTGIELAAFIDGECRGAMKDKNGTVYLSVFGEYDDDYKTITFKAFIDGEEVALDQTVEMLLETNISYMEFTFSGQPQTKHITLDEHAAENTFTAAASADVTLVRNFGTGYWNTLCVPFGIDAETLIATFGEGTRVMEFSGATEEVVRFASVAEVTAGVPCLLLPANEVSNPKFAGVEIISPEELLVAPGGSPYEFVGTYCKYAMHTDRSQIFITKDNQLAYPFIGSNVLYGTRAFIRTSNGGEFSSKFGLQFDDNGTTGIWNIAGNGEADGLYTTSGLKLTDTKHLPKGVYIKNGRKVIVK